MIIIFNHSIEKQTTLNFHFSTLYAKNLSKGKHRNLKAKKQARYTAPGIM